MARTQFSAAVYDAKHFQNYPRLKKRLQSLYDKVYDEVARIGAATGWHDPNAEFHLSDFPVAEKKIERLLQGLSTDVQSLITDGNDRAWDLSFEKNRAMTEWLAQRLGLSQEVVNHFSKRNLAARQAFQERTERGMNLSDRVWDFVKHDRAKMEMALELGLSQGKSAAALSRDVREYLNEPHKLFRRVRDKDGVLRLSKAAQAYHPGRGVYRSSYKNALRMTITENNMAYRTADFENWKNMSFVTGVIIKLSGTHPEADICDTLKGEYPKGFKFVGWHPHCRCYVVAKMASREELNKFSKLSDADQVNYRFPGQVDNVPPQFSKWVEDNAERIQAAKSLPYFIKDNFVGGNIKNKMNFQVEQARPLTTLERAAQRHAQRTPQQAADIQARWDADRARVNTRSREQILEAAKQRQAARTTEQINDIKDRWALRADEMQYSPEQRAMFREIEKELGIKRGFSMPYLRADQQNANPMYGKGKQYGINCQTCAPAYQLRLWGFDVYALGNTEKKGNLSAYLSGASCWDEIWQSAKTGKRKGLYPFESFGTKNGWKNYNKNRYKEYFDKCCPNDGVYEVGLSWKGGGGHCTIVERRNGKMRYIEPQVDNAPGTPGAWRDYESLCDRMTAKPMGLYDGVVRTDNAIINIKKFAPIFGKNAAVPLHKQRVLNAAAVRHEARTAEQVKDIKARWKEHQEALNIQLQKEKIMKLSSLEDLKKMRAAYTGNNAELRRAYIDRAAELRHAARNDAKTRETWKDYRHKQEVIRTAASNVAKVASNTPWINADEVDKLTDAKTHAAHLDELQKHTQDMVKRIQEVNADIKQLETLIPNAKTWAGQFTSQELHDAYNGINKTLNGFKAKYAGDSYLQAHYTEDEYLKKKLVYEIKDVAAKQKYNTWKVSEAAYTKQLEAVEKNIILKEAAQKLNTFGTYLAAHPKSAKLANLISEAEAAVKAGDVKAFKQKAFEIDGLNAKLEHDAARRRNKPGAYDLPKITNKEAEKLFKAFGSEYTDVMDDLLRPQTRDAWLNILTDEERLVLTKYTQTYCYLNEPLREMKYSGCWTYAEFSNDMPILTKALSKLTMPKTTVIRRGTDDYPIKALGKNLSELQPGDTFVDGGFLSTSVRTDTGFFRQMDMRIVVPKGAQGVYAEPFTHYNDSEKLDYSTNKLWDAKKDLSLGGEREWIGQRGSKFEVVRRDGNTIFLKLVGQQYDQTTNYQAYIK